MGRFMVDLEAASGFFGTTLENIYQSVSDKVVSAFDRLDTDMHRVAFVTNMKHFQNETNELVKPNFRGKFTKLCEEARTKGNKLFGRREYDMALKRYTESVLFAPAEENSNMLALALANRSAALYHLDQIPACLRDIQAAFKYRYPKNLHYKLYDRMGKCYKALEVREIAIANFEKAKEALDVAELDNKKHTTWMNDMDQQLKGCYHLPSKEADQNMGVDSESRDPTENIKYGNNPQYPSASSALEIRYTQNKGRYTMAMQDIEIGDTLISEKPYATSLLPEFYTSHCFHCFKRVQIPFPCRQCSSVRYCSDECSELSWDEHHSVECKYTKLLTESGISTIGTIALRIITTTGLDKLLAFRETIKDLNEGPSEKAGIGADGKYENTYRAVYSLVPNTEHRDNKEMMHLSLVAAFLLKILQSSGFFSKSNEAITGEEVAYIGGLLLRSIQQTLCSAHEITELILEDDFRKSNFITLGPGVFVTSSLLNHSCNPCIDRNFYHGTKAVVRAVRPIKKGEEISDEYGALFFLQNREDRQAMLRRQYFFVCNCEACVGNWPLYEDLKDKAAPHVKCVACGTPVYKSKEGGLEKVECDKCCTVQDVQERLDTLMESRTSFIDAMKGAIKGDVVAATPVFEKHLTEMDAIFFQPYAEYNNCQAALKQCYQVLGNCTKKSDL